MTFVIINSGFVLFQDGQAAIHFAVGNGREEIVNMLVKKRADLNLKGGVSNFLILMPIIGCHNHRVSSKIRVKGL